LVLHVGHFKGRPKM